MNRRSRRHRRGQWRCLFASFLAEEFCGISRRSAAGRSIHFQIDGYFTTIGTTQSVKNNPHVKVLAYTGRAGSVSHLPGVKTFAELGVPNMLFHSSYSVAVRSGTPEPVRTKLAEFVRQAATSAAMEKARRDLYLEGYEGSLDDYKRELKGLADEFAASANGLKKE